MTRAPLARVRSWNSGKLTGWSGSGGGASVGACAISVLAPPVRKRASARPDRIRLFVMDSSSLLAGHGRLRIGGGGLLRRDDGDDGAVLDGQILPRDGLDLL